VLEAIETANSIGWRRTALTDRDGGKLDPTAQLNSSSRWTMGRIEGAHMSACHMIGHYFTEMEC